MGSNAMNAICRLALFAVALVAMSQSLEAEVETWSDVHYTNSATDERWWTQDEEVTMYQATCGNIQWAYKLQGCCTATDEALVEYPFDYPTPNPTPAPSEFPSAEPSVEPSQYPTSKPSDQPSAEPSVSPSQYPTSEPSTSPSAEPSVAPSVAPSAEPSVSPSQYPTSEP